MIRNHWYAVLESSEVKTGKPLGVKRLGEKLVFWRDASGGVFCVSDKCAHRGAALSLGEVEGNCIRCPFHGIEFAGDGRGRRIPANGKNAPVPENFRVRAYPVREKYNFIWIWWGAGYPENENSLPELPFFEDIDESFSYATLIDPWKVHYSRCIENQLDVVHLPFVHKKTIGRGGQTIVNGPLVRTEGDNMNIWVYNETDTGQTPKKPEEVPVPEEGRQHLHFRFPNIWQNWLTEKARIFISFVPVDEENSLLYMRFYQKFIRIPFLKGFVNAMGIFFSKRIAHEDRRVVHTQEPKKTELKMDENLLQGDLPIVHYRRYREKLKQQNG